MAAFNPLSMYAGYTVARIVLRADRVVFIDFAQGTWLAVLFGWFLLFLWAIF